MKEAVESWNPKESSLDVIVDANDIIEEYQEQGFVLTLRQLYYQFVTRDLFPENRRWRWTGSKWVRDPNGTKNAQPNYTWLKTFINRGRLAGYIDWRAIEDRTRNLESNYHYKGPMQAIQDALDTYEINMWENQPIRIEVWVEKEALAGVVAKACRPLDVPFFCCRGYVSQSEQWRAGKRFLRYAGDHEQPTIVLHFGDHDPSGVDMTRDNRDRQNMFTHDVGIVDIRRMALNMDQIQELNPPPSPAKVTDSRWEGYVQEFGDDSWELDALEPKMITDLITEEVISIRDKDRWDEKIEERDHHIATLEEIIQNLDD